MFRNEVHGKNLEATSLTVGAGVHDVTGEAFQGQVADLQKLLPARWTSVEVRLAAEADVMAVLTDSYRRLHVLQAYRAF
jgi:hypothetical protein